MNWSGINLLCLGVIGEYLGRTYLEAKSRPLYFVREAVGFAKSHEGKTGTWRTIAQDSEKAYPQYVKTSMSIDSRLTGS